MSFESDEQRAPCLCSDPRRSVCMRMRALVGAFKQVDARWKRNAKETQ
jgi:hypothetical protein